MPRFKVRTLNDARHVAMMYLDQGALVVARIDVQGTSDSKKDKRYGIKVKAGEPRLFFVIADSKYDDKKDNYKDGRKITRWSVDGLKVINGKQTLVPTGKDGALRYCRMKHAFYQRLFGANFLSCLYAPRAAKISARIYGADSGSAERLWMPCGRNSEAAPRIAKSCHVTKALDTILAGVAALAPPSEAEKRVGRHPKDDPCRTARGSCLDGVWRGLLRC